MKKTGKKLFYFILFMIIGVYMTVTESVKYIVKGSSVFFRVAIAGIYIGAILGLFINPFTRLAVLGIILLLDTIFSLNMVRYSEDFDFERKSGTYERESAHRETAHSSFFEGMSIEDAKKEYRKLMKQYHPDNEGGDLEMSQKISEDYRRFCGAHGR